jgi:hypothetical protein
MAYKPLMLSDTAMVLLHHYAEISNHRRVVSHFMELMSASSPDSALQPSSKNWHVTSLRYRDMGAMQHEILTEIWLVWAFPDLVPIRSLEWHLILDAPLMTLLEEIFVSRPEYPFRARLKFFIGRDSELIQFIDLLESTYEVSLAQRKSCSEKNQS